MTYSYQQQLIKKAKAFYKSLLTNDDTFLYFYFSLVNIKLADEKRKLSIYHNETFHISTQVDLNKWLFALDNVYNNCTFFVDAKLRETIDMHSFAFINCKIKLYGKALPATVKVHPAQLIYIGDNLVVSAQQERREHFSQCNRFGYCSCTVSTRRAVLVKREEAALEIVFHRFDIELSKTNKNTIGYADRSFEFSPASVVAGVELELPVYFNENHLDKRLWLYQEDGSQITGNFEAVSIPCTFEKVTSEKMQQQIKRLYKQANVPTDVALWNGGDSDNDGSGIHLHLSWKDNFLPFTASELYPFIWTIVEARGGKKWLLKQGGKGSACFDKYSPYPDYPVASSKYNFVAIKSNTHLEMRWSCNNPDPAIVMQRIRTMAALFVDAVKLAIADRAYAVAVNVCYNGRVTKYTQPK